MGPGVFPYKSIGVGSILTRTSLLREIVDGKYATPPNVFRDHWLPALTAKFIKFAAQVIGSNGHTNAVGVSLI